MKKPLSRRFRIGLIVLVPLVAALFVGWVESRTWVVVENIGDDPVQDVLLVVRGEAWEIGLLEPGESRRRRIGAATSGACTIELTSSVHEVRRDEISLEDGGTCLVRVAGREMTITARPNAWRQWLRW
jgi:hypothetical protein